MKLPLPAALGLMVLSAAALARAEGAGAPTEYTLKFSPQALVMVAKGLQKLPYEDVAAILQDVQRQVDEQMKAAAAKPEPPK